MDRFHAIQTFVKVAESGGFAAAARDLARGEIERAGECGLDALAVDCPAREIVRAFASLDGLEHSGVMIFSRSSGQKNTSRPILR